MKNIIAAVIILFASMSFAGSTVVVVGQPTAAAGSCTAEFTEDTYFGDLDVGRYNDTMFRMIEFTPASSWDITKVQIALYETGDVDAKTYTIDIRDGSNNSLGSCTFAGSLIAGGFVGCTMASAVSLTGSTEYRLVVSVDGSSSTTNYALWAWDDGGTGDGFKSTDGSSWTTTTFTIIPDVILYSGAGCTGN